jgi:transcriptional regulator with XRE-family HTH domain
MPKDLGEKIRNLRIRRGLSQASLARHASVSRRHVSEIERGANVSVDTLMRIATTLDLSELAIGPVKLTVAPVNNIGSSAIAAAAQDLEEARRRIGAALSKLGVEISDV